MQFLSEPERQHIYHFIWECQNIQRFWNDFVIYFNTACEELPDLNINATFIIIGTSNVGRVDPVLYFIILLAKQYIYHCKLDNKTPNLLLFKEMLYKRYCVEEYNARIKNIKGKFDSKWQKYLPFLT